MKLPAKAQKILMLALDSAAPTGEWEAAAIKFVAILRKASFRYEEAPPSDIHGRTRPYYEYVTMPFGKYKGQFLCVVPTDYLEWVLSIDKVKPFLQQAVRDVLASRTTV